METKPGQRELVAVIEDRLPTETRTYVWYTGTLDELEAKQRLFENWDHIKEWRDQYLSIVVPKDNDKVQMVYDFIDSEEWINGPELFGEDDWGEYYGKD